MSRMQLYMELLNRSQVFQHGILLLILMITALSQVLAGVIQKMTIL